jgi:hypothetical protein
VPDLDFFPECSYQPDRYRHWTIDNPTPVAVTVEWRIADSPYSGTITVPANGSVALNTPTVPNNPNLLILSVGGVPIAVSLSDPTQCATPPTPSPRPPVPSPPPTGNGGNLPGMPNTGTGADSAASGAGRQAVAVGALALLGSAAILAGGWRRRRDRSA